MAQRRKPWPTAEALLAAAQAYKAGHAARQTWTVATWRTWRRMLDAYWEAVYQATVGQA